jgi:predicted ABC-type ATPase
MQWYLKLTVQHIIQAGEIPVDVLNRCYARSLSNFFTIYAPLANQWALFDNSSSPQALPVAAQLADELIITEAKTWQKLQKLSKTA